MLHGDKDHVLLLRVLLSGSVSLVGRTAIGSLVPYLPALRALQLTPSLAPTTAAASASSTPTSATTTAAPTSTCTSVAAAPCSLPPAGCPLWAATPLVAGLTTEVARAAESHQGLLLTISSRGGQAWLNLLPLHVAEIMGAEVMLHLVVVVAEALQNGAQL